MTPYALRRVLGNGDVDLHMRLRTSTLFALFQEASIRHSEALGVGRAATLDRGFLWVVTLQRADILRMPVYGEAVTVETWPGPTMHVLFPRHYRLLDAQGEPLLRASALWTLMDERTRRMVFPEEAGIAVEGWVTGEECPLPAPLPRVEPQYTRQVQVPYSYVDLNGHMNHTRYFDLAEDAIPAAAQGLPLEQVCSEFAGEARLGDTFTLGVGEQEGTYCVSGESERRLFRLKLRYGPAQPSPRETAGE